MSLIETIIVTSDLPDVIKHNLILFVKLQGFKEDIIYVKNKRLNNYFDIIADYQQLLMPFDIEFYQYLIKKDLENDYHIYNKSKLLDYYSINSIRELGGLLFIRN